MPHKDERKDVRVYFTPDEHKYLKAVAKENGLSMTALLRKATLEKCKYKPPKKERQKIALPKKATDEPPTAKVNDTKELETRLREVNTILNKAKKGERLPLDEYRRLTEEQGQLRRKLGHN